MNTHASDNRESGGHATPAHWRSLEEAAQTPEFREGIHNEFLPDAAGPISDVSRRNFLQVVGASLAMAGAAGCARQPEESIFPYVKPPEEIIPGHALYFASAFPMGGYITGVLVESQMGRPTKIEGNPGHPSSRGTTDVHAQASVLDLYDPDRSKRTLHNGRISGWDAFVAQMRVMLDNLALDGGEGVRVLSETVTSPTLSAQLDTFLARYPNAKLHQYDGVNRDSAYDGAVAAFGKYVDTIYHFDQADVVLSLDSDFLVSGVGNVRYAGDFSTRRVVPEHSGGEEHAHGGLNRLYAVESTPSGTGVMAEHRLGVRPSQVEAIARCISEKAGAGGLPTGDSGLSADQVAWAQGVADDLRAHEGNSIVIAGDHQPAAVHTIAHILNHALGNVGHTVSHKEPASFQPTNHNESLRELVSDMQAGAVKLLLIIGGNPLYSAPVDLEFAAALEKVETGVHHSLYEDETSALCTWHTSEAHYLETWSDGRGHDGTVALIQPLIAPLHGGKSVHELFSALLDDIPLSSYDVLRAHWTKQHGEVGFEAFWAQSLSTGVVEGTASADASASVRTGALGEFSPPPASNDLEIVFCNDPSVSDGRFSNNVWLQEIPNSLSKLTWDNAIILGYSTAKRLGLENEQVVRLTYQGRTIEGPVWKQPGHCSDTVTVHHGYGRTRSGIVGTGIGFSANAIRTSNAPTIGVGASIEATNETYPLARTEGHFNMHERGLVRTFSAESYERDPAIVHKGFHEPGDTQTMYKPQEHAWDGNAWGMTIDLNKCTGCNACIMACQAENNIHAVGKHEVRMGREMHWLRLDRYYGGNDLDNPDTYFQPVPCMQCENAPCEVVCPVGATQHSEEGLNDMVYNRCIGTRYCSNNCPYKVRRFNFYNYARTPRAQKSEIYPESMKVMYNPDVTVRTRGVMEKCTYCVQRINLARIDSKKKGQSHVDDGAVVTACQQVCPSAAITFGNINDAESEVAQFKESHRNYSILADLNTRPRTTYLARITNANPEVKT